MEEKTVMETWTKDETWTNVLNFLCSELFGDDVFWAYQNHSFVGRPAGDDEPVFEVALSTFEKRFYDLVDATGLYLREHNYRLPRGEGEEKLNIAKALKEIFWAMIKLNHPEFFKPPSGIGIRTGYQIVALPRQEGPSIEMIPFPFTKGGR